jgi:hypothetical protein
VTKSGGDCDLFNNAIFPIVEEMEVHIDFSLNIEIRGSNVSGIFGRACLCTSVQIDMEIY